MKVVNLLRIVIISLILNGSFGNLFAAQVSIGIGDNKNEAVFKATEGDDTVLEFAGIIKLECTPKGKVKEKTCDTEVTSKIQAKNADLGTTTFTAKVSKDENCCLGTMKIEDFKTPDGTSGLRSRTFQRCCDGKSDPGPLLATLSKFLLTNQENKVWIEWQTLSELDNIGFNIWCAQIKENEFGESEFEGIIKLNQELIPAKNDLDGAIYQTQEPYIFNDGITYCMLENVNTEGVSNKHCNFIRAIVIGNDEAQSVDLKTAENLCQKHTGVGQMECVID